jgi:hypothetical protein
VKPIELRLSGATVAAVQFRSALCWPNGETNDSAGPAIGQLGYLKETSRRTTSGFAPILNAKKALPNVKQKLYLAEEIFERDAPSGGH